MPTKLCRPHDVGVPLNAPPFFYDGCPACEAKKAAGKVTGNEGPLPDHRKRPHGDRAKFIARAKRDQAGRRKAWLARLEASR